MLTCQLEMLTPEYYSSEAFANLRKSYLNSTEKLSATEKRIHDLEAELESTKRELLSAHNDRKFFPFHLNVFKTLADRIYSEHDRPRRP